MARGLKEVVIAGIIVALFRGVGSYRDQQGGPLDNSACKRCCSRIRFDRIFRRNEDDWNNYSAWFSNCGRLRKRFRLMYAQKGEDVKRYFDRVSKTGRYVRSWVKKPWEYYGDMLKQLSQHSEKIDSLLDIGCGSGQFLQAVQKAVEINQLYGIDFSKEMLSFISSTTKRHVSFLQGDTLRLPFKANSFDCLNMDLLLHHVIAENRAKSKNCVKTAIQEAMRVLKPNGFLFLSELYFESFGISTLTSHVTFSLLAFFNKLGIKFPLKESPKGLVACFYTKSELRQLIRSAGGTILKEQVDSWKVGFKERLAFLHKRGKIRFFIQT